MVIDYKNEALAALNDLRETYFNIREHVSLYRSMSGLPDSVIYEMNHLLDIIGIIHWCLEGIENKPDLWNEN